MLPCTEMFYVVWPLPQLFPLSTESNHGYLSSIHGKHATQRGQSRKLFGVSIDRVPTDELLHPFYQKQRNRLGLNNCPDCLTNWYTPHCGISFLFLLLSNGTYLCFHSSQVPFVNKTTLPSPQRLTPTQHGWIGTQFHTLCLHSGVSQFFSGRF